MRVKMKGTVNIVLDKEDTLELCDIILECQQRTYEVAVGTRVDTAIVLADPPDKDSYLETRLDCFKKIAEFLALEVEYDSVRPEGNGTDAAVRNKG